MSSDTPFTQQAEVIEGLDAPEDSSGPSVVDQIIAARQMKKGLEQQTNVNEAGAPILTPKAALFSTFKAKKHPANAGKHLRWVNTTIEEKVQARLEAGYERVPESEGGRSLGKEYALFRISQEKADQRRAAQQRVADSRLKSHNALVERQADEIAKVLRDKYGLDVDASNILIK